MEQRSCVSGREGESGSVDSVGRRDTARTTHGNAESRQTDPSFGPSKLLKVLVQSCSSLDQLMTIPPRLLPLSVPRLVHSTSAANPLRREGRPQDEEDEAGHEAVVQAVLDATLLLSSSVDRALPPRAVQGDHRLFDDAIQLAPRDHWRPLTQPRLEVPELVVVGRASEDEGVIENFGEGVGGDRGGRGAEGRREGLGEGGVGEGVEWEGGESGGSSSREGVEKGKPDDAVPTGGSTEESKSALLLRAAGS